MIPNQVDSAGKDKYPIDVPGVLASAQAFTSQISLLVDEIDRLRAENAQQKMELEQMSSTFKTTLALKNRKIRELKEEVGVKNETEEIGDFRGVLSGASLTYKVTNISKLTDTPMFQNGIPVFGVEWVLSVYKIDNRLAVTVTGKKISGDSHPNFSLFLYLLEDGDDMYTTNAEFSEAIVIEGNLIYELPSFIPFEDVLDENNGYVKDDSINIEVDINIVK